MAKDKVENDELVLLHQMVCDLFVSDVVASGDVIIIDNFL